MCCCCCCCIDFESVGAFWAFGRFFEAESFSRGLRRILGVRLAKAWFGGGGVGVCFWWLPLVMVASETNEKKPFWRNTTGCCVMWRAFFWILMLLLVVDGWDCCLCCVVPPNVNCCSRRVFVRLLLTSNSQKLSKQLGRNVRNRAEMCVLPWTRFVVVGRVTWRFMGWGHQNRCFLRSCRFHVGFACRSPVIPKTMRIIRLFGAKRIQFYPPRESENWLQRQNCNPEKKFHAKSIIHTNKFFLAGERALPFNSFIRHAPIHRSHHPTFIHHH